MWERRMAKGRTEAEDEQHVRRYLQWLANPDSARDSAEIERLQLEFDAEPDPIERLRIAAQLVRLESPDVDELRSAFVAAARPWAERYDVPLEAFRRVGVPDRDLRDAGLIGSRSGRHGHRSLPKKRHTIDDVTRHLPTEAFSIKSLQEHSGASTMTVRKSIRRLLDAGTIEELGPDPDYAGPGRAPMLYRSIT